MKNKKQTMKRLLSALLCLAMVLSLMPTAVLAAEGAPVCDCGTDDPAIHAVSCAVYVAPENPECFCTEKCTEVNEWCDVCGFDYTACAASGEEEAAVYEAGYATVEGAAKYGVRIGVSATCSSSPGHHLILLTATDTSRDSYWGSEISITTEGWKTLADVTYQCPGCQTKHEISGIRLVIYDYSCAKQFAEDIVHTFDNGDALTVSLHKDLYDVFENELDYHDLNIQNVDYNGQLFHFVECNLCVLNFAGLCSGDDVANCTTEGTCTTCGKKYSVPDAHTVSDQWKHTTTQHYQFCVNGCGEQYNIGEHSWKNGSCAVCGYGCIHSYDKDSQTYRCSTCNMMCPHRYYDSVCTDCGMECLEHTLDGGICTECGYYCEHDWDHYKYQYYSVCNYCGLLCGHSYHEAYRMEATCSAQGVVNYKCAFCTSEKNEILDALGHDFVGDYTDTTHTGECRRCDYVSTGFHEYSREYFDATCTEDGYYTDTCTGCGYSKKTVTSTKLNHYGGEATCKALAVCERCGKGYGEIGDHVGGEATCTKQAICDVCGEGYGELKRHESELDDSDCTTPVRCSVCGAVTKEANATHTWGEDNFCSNENCQQTKGFTFTFTYGDEVLFVRNVHTGNFYTFEGFEERDGLTLVGWDENDDGEVDYAIDDYIYVEGDLSFEAVYKLVYTVHFITYDIWEGAYTESFNPIMGEANQTVTLWDNASPYYKFLGWAMEEGGEVVYEANEEIALTQNLTLYGVIRPYRATFELGEGAVWNDENGDPITALEGDYSGSWIEIRKFPTRTGYIFQGFVDQTEMLWEPYEDEDTGEWILEFYFDRADREMTAVWEECTEHVYDDANDADCNICGAKNPNALTITGNYKTFGDASDAITIQLVPAGKTEPAYVFSNADTLANSGAWHIDAVAKGTYTVKVIKKNHVTREYSITVGNDAMKLDVEIWLLGDVTGDGRVNFSDYAKVLSQAKNPSAGSLEGYALACGDVTVDGRINFSDYAKVLSQAKGMHSLW